MSTAADNTTKRETGKMQLETVQIAEDSAINDPSMQDGLKSASAEAVYPVDVKPNPNVEIELEGLEDVNPTTARKPKAKPTVLITDATPRIKDEPDDELREISDGKDERILLKPSTATADGVDVTEESEVATSPKEKPQETVSLIHNNAVFRDEYDTTSAVQSSSVGGVDRATSAGPPVQSDARRPPRMSEPARVCGNVEEVQSQLVGNPPPVEVGQPSREQTELQAESTRSSTQWIPMLPQAFRHSNSRMEMQSTFRIEQPRGSNSGVLTQQRQVPNHERQHTAPVTSGAQGSTYSYGRTQFPPATPYGNVPRASQPPILAGKSPVPTYVQGHSAKSHPLGSQNGSQLTVEALEAQIEREKQWVEVLHQRIGDAATRFGQNDPRCWEQHQRFQSAQQTLMSLFSQLIRMKNDEAEQNMARLHKKTPLSMPAQISSFQPPLSRGGLPSMSAATRADTRVPEPILPRLTGFPQSTPRNAAPVLKGGSTAVVLNRVAQPVSPGGTRFRYQVKSDPALGSFSTQVPARMTTTVQHTSAKPPIQTQSTTTNASPDVISLLSSSPEALDHGPASPRSRSSSASAEPLSWKLPSYEMQLQPTTSDDDLRAVKVSLPGMVREEMLLSPDHAEQEVHLLLNVFIPGQQGLDEPDPQPAVALLNFHTIAVMVLEAYTQFEIGDETSSLHRPASPAFHSAARAGANANNSEHGKSARDADVDEIFFAVMDRWRAGRASNKESYEFIRGVQEFVDVVLDLIYYVKEHGLLKDKPEDKTRKVRKDKGVARAAYGKRGGGGDIDGDGRAEDDGRADDEGGDSGDAAQKTKGKGKAPANPRSKQPVKTVATKRKTSTSRANTLTARKKVKTTTPIAAAAAKPSTKPAANSKRIGPGVTVIKRS